MTFNHRDKRFSRTSKFDVECLGERIAPAVTGIMGGVHHMFVNHGSHGQFQTLATGQLQPGSNAQANHRFGTIDGNKMSLGIRFVTSSAKVNHRFGTIDGNKMSLGIHIATPAAQANQRFGTIDGNKMSLGFHPVTPSYIVKAPPKVFPMPPKNSPPPPVVLPFGAVSLNIVKQPPKPVPISTNPPTTPTPPHLPVATPFSLASHA